MAIATVCLAFIAWFTYQNAQRWAVAAYYPLFEREQGIAWQLLDSLIGVLNGFSVEDNKPWIMAENLRKLFSQWKENAYVRRMVRKNISEEDFNRLVEDALATREREWPDSVSARLLADKASRIISILRVIRKEDLSLDRETLLRWYRTL